MKVIEYYRVSTAKQGQSGLGLEAQERAVRAYLHSAGAESVARFVEVESGGNKDRITAQKDVTIDKLIQKRPTLQQAIHLAGATGATIVVKESSRLSRFSLIIDYLMYLRVHFVCADNPNDDEFFIKMRVLFGEEELRKISERTRKALASRRQRGLKLGNPEQFHDEGRRKGAARVKQLALASDTNKQILDTILDKVHRGMSPQQIASHLNSINLKTIRGKMFRTGTINMYLKRARELQLV
ncbi:hypothetical protein DXT99_25030 [Pontibacter diazotrophicus]|uniref:Resolvase/invertase-type recombinase catalytic domain-containing protein n=1 Tax=Pontibacter diazotrophicus TaxID=1400979 RepID=A0A3D8L1M4_9BACT|nr:recombinase family protein [Pontibacter diazotrophicus]RDV11300.1 hypothetical protein DXT99_25030 [Pontibacter diazotrophicus]